jgi:hypothetical protein
MTLTEFTTLVETNLEDFSNIVPEKLREVLYALFQGTSKTGDLRQIRILETEIPVQFDTTGLGRINKDYYGWAICNGANGTVDDRGRTYIGWKQSIYPMNSQGGSKDHTLTIDEVPSHDHESVLYNDNTNSVNDAGSGPVGAGVEPNDSNGSGNINKTGLRGGGQPHNNMQPYTVVLFIQKIT